MKDDATLLHSYAHQRSEADFAELVRRHVDLVYSVALRELNGDAHLAQDATQLVFIDLARKADRLTGHRLLAGWLFNSTRYAAANLVRGVRRRQAREAKAQLMETMNAPEPADAAEWERVRPVLDAALGELNERDREAVLLRFLQNRDYAAIGARLALSDNAARMCVDRALDKLRTVLARRRAEHEAWTNLAGEIATLRNRLEAKKPAAVASPSPIQARSLKEASLTRGEWRNAGQENPAAAFETFLWAAASGEVEELAAGLELDDATRGKAAAIFNRLPPALQREVGTPGQLVALLTARDVPLGSAWIMGQFDMRPNETRVVAQLADPEGNKRDLLFTLREREGRWRLVVPPQVMTKYAAFLQGEPVEPPVR